MYSNTKKYTYTTQAQVRAAFWEAHFINGKPAQFKGKSQNELPAYIRTAWCDYVDGLQKIGMISEALASRVTL